jgi:nucleoside-diphosphate-sugar epimerase
MDILFVGGTGLISSACSALALERGHALTLVTRATSTKYPVPKGAQIIQADVHGEEAEVARQLEGRYFDVVVDWIAFHPADIERDLRLFQGKTDQFVFISSASAYEKPPKSYLITEETPLANPFWDYSRNKIACEKLLIREHRDRGFPVTIIRPSHTYGPSQIPVMMGSWQHPYTVVDRMKRRQKIIVPGDGTSLWVLTWNEDFAVGLLGLFGREDAQGEAFQITSDEVLTWDQICKETAQAVGVEVGIVHVPSDLISAYDPGYFGSLIGDKANSLVFDNSKIKRFVPEFSCKVTWAEGVRRALAWFEADPARCTLDLEADRLWDVILAAYLPAFPKPQP